MSLEGRRYTAEDAVPGRPVVLRSVCQCGLLIVTAGRTVRVARRRAGRAVRDHAAFAALARGTEPG